jgi:hypothetical protein
MPICTCLSGVWPAQRLVVGRLLPHGNTVGWFGWWIGFLIPVHIAASVSFVPFIRSIASLVVCRFSWASWRGGLDLPFRMPWIVASLAPCTVGETQPGFGCQSPLVASGAKQLSATGG